MLLVRKWLPALQYIIEGEPYTFLLCIIETWRLFKGRARPQMDRDVGVGCALSLTSV